MSRHGTSGASGRPSFFTVFGRAALVALVGTLMTSASAAGAAELVLVTAAKATYSRALPGEVLVLDVTVANRGDEAAEARIDVQIDAFPSRRGSRQISVPPRTSDRYEVDLPLPEDLGEGTALELTITLVGAYGGREVILERDGTPMSYTMRLLLDEPDSLAAMAMERDPPPTLY